MLLRLKRSFSHDFPQWTRRLQALTTCSPSSASFSTTAIKSQAIRVELDEKVEKQLESAEIRPKRHFGVNKLLPEAVPKRIRDAMMLAVGDFPIKKLLSSGEVFNRYIKCRKAPMEQANIKLKMQEIEELVLSDPIKYKIPVAPDPSADETTQKLFQSRKKQTVETIVKQRIYSWQAIHYDQHKALLYLLSRSAVEFSVLTRIFREIVKRDPEFKPKSYFDFGSGVGTGVWAASEMWKDSIYEYYLVDTSKYMNDLSDLILRDGNPNKSMFIRNVYHRQFLPARNEKYDIVLSAYSMFELSELRNRLEVAQNLWNKAQQYLIFVEVGTNAGFQVLNELRDYLMQVKEINAEDAFIFSPCAHDKACPRFELHDGTPCNFEVAYNTLPFSGPQEILKDTYSYLVIKKGKQTQDSDSWPRIVRPTLQRHKHVVCRMCTKDGKLEEGIFTKVRHGRHAYKCIRNSNWGDQLPIKILENDQPVDGEDSESEDDQPVKV